MSEVVVCPCCAMGAERAKEALEYSDYRAWWRSHVVGLPVPKRRVKQRPEPATVDFLDPELG